MEFAKQNISNYYLYDTPVENLFISEYMAGAPGDYVKAYLLALMYAQMNMPTDSREIGKALGLSAAAMEECWDYWESLGVIAREYFDPKDNSRCDIRFVNLRESAFGRRAPCRKTSAASHLDDESFAKLLRDVEIAGGRMLESREPETISSWICDYNMDPSFILFGYKFCASKGRSTKSRYVAAVLKDWKSKGLETAAEVESYLEGMDKHYSMYRQVFKELGFSRSPSEEEKRIMNRWFDDYGFGLDKVFEACKHTAGITNPNINYVDRVLTSWYKESSGLAEPSKANAAAALEKYYEEERAKNAEKTERIRREVYAAIPRVKEIGEELRQCSFDLSRAMLSGSSSIVKREKARADALAKERTELLTSHGYSSNAMDAIYTCSRCRDTGYLDDGTRCSCYGERLQQLMKQER